MSRRALARQNRRALLGPFPFDPSRLAGLVMWVRADKGITQSVGKVSRWADQSGRGNDLIQNTGANQPSFTASWTNGQPGVTFASASTTYMQTAAFTGGNLSVGTVFVVFSQQAGAGDQVIFDGRDATNRWMLDPNNTNGVADQFAGASLLTTLSAGAYTNPQSMILSYAGASSSLWRNGAIAGGPGNAGSNALAGLTVGATNALVAPLDGTIAEIAVYSQAYAVGLIAPSFEAYAKGRYATP